MKGFKLAVVVLVLFAAGVATAAAAAVGPGSRMHLLSWEEYSVVTGRSKSVQVAVNVSLSHHLQGPAPSPDLHKLFRRKRLIYGRDDRVRIDPGGEGRKYPYTTQMKVSTGCSGVMVTKKHILTAAHCVHDGNQYLPSALYFLRAGYLEPDRSTKWHFVRRFFVPGQWKNLTADKRHAYSDWDDYDVAVLELVSEIGGERDAIPPGLSGLFCHNRKSIHGTKSKVEFVSFPDDKSDEAMWYIQTDIVTESRNLIYFRGAAWHGSSGAGMIAWDYNKSKGKYDRRVVGVLSGNRNTEAIAKIQGKFNVGARLSPVSFALVCHWIGTWEACYHQYRDYLDPDRQPNLCK